MRIVILVLIIFLFTSCRLMYYKAPDYLKKQGFTFKYEEEQTALKKILNINGYFTVNDTLNSGNIVRPNNNMMFFNDGMFLTDFDDCCDTLREHIGKVIPMFMDSVVIDRKLGHRKYQFYEFPAWGHYKVSGDTIKLQYVHRPMWGGMNRFWYAYEWWFKVIDRNTLEAIYRYPIHKLNQYEKTDWEKRKKEGDLFKSYFKVHFRPVPEIPESDGWLKYEGWFWKNKEEYEKWKIQYEKK